MKKIEMFGYLKEKFDFSKDDGSFEFILKNDDTGFLSFIPNLGGTEKKQQLLGLPIMNLAWYMCLELEIFQDEDGYVRPFDVGEQYRFYPDDGIVKESDIDNMISDFFSWFKSASSPDSVRLKMKNFYEKKTNFPPARWQFKHVVACVLKGDSKTLKEYLSAFEAGDRMGFIPSIKAEHFERAINLAGQYESGRLSVPIDF